MEWRDRKQSKARQLPHPTICQWQGIHFPFKHTWFVHEGRIGEAKWKLNSNEVAVCTQDKRDVKPRT